jgi:hypothetical protein
MGDIRSSQAEPPIAAGGAGVTAFQAMKSFPPAPLLNSAFGGLTLFSQFRLLPDE